MTSGKDAKRRKDRAKRKAARDRKFPKREVKRPLLYLPYAGAIPDALIEDILAKRDLLVHPDLARTVLARYLGKHPELVERLEEPTILRSAAYELAKKWTRQELRVLVGMFIVETDPAKLLDARSSVILASHQSTRERQEQYETLYADLFAGRAPRVILDLCAGLNPCSYDYLGCKPKYIAVDVSPQLMDFVQAWFAHHHIDGTAYAADVTTMTTFPDADTVFLFKATDVLERVKYGFGEELLTKLITHEQRRVIVSFATATIGGGREIKLSKRSWVERWAAQHGVSVRVHDLPNERFYVLTP